MSAIVSFELFARPALRLMAGERIVDRPRFGPNWRSPSGGHRTASSTSSRVRAWLDIRGQVRVTPLEGQESHQLSVLAAANALAMVPDGPGLDAGASVDTMLLDTERLARDGAAPFAAGGMIPMATPVTLRRTRPRSATMPTPDRSSTRSVGCTATCASRSPTTATFAARTACPRRG